MGAFGNVILRRVPFYDMFSTFVLVSFVSFIFLKMFGKRPKQVVIINGRCWHLQNQVAIFRSVMEVKFTKNCACAARTPGGEEQLSRLRRGFSSIFVLEPLMLKTYLRKKTRVEKPIATSRIISSSTSMSNSKMKKAWLGNLWIPVIGNTIFYRYPLIIWGLSSDMDFPYHK